MSSVTVPKSVSCVIVVSAVAVGTGLGVGEGVAVAPGGSVTGVVGDGLDRVALVVVGGTDAQPAAISRRATRTRPRGIRAR